MERDDEQGTSKESQPDLRFGNGMVAVAGAISGMAIALGGTAAVLYLGQGLGAVLQCTLVIIALGGGSLVCLVSAFFGLVMPRHLRGGPWMDPDKWRRFAEERRRWHRDRWHRRYGMGFDGGEDDEDAGRPGRGSSGAQGRGPRRAEGEEGPARRARTR
jgi:hypothetical protein